MRLEPIRELIAWVSLAVAAVLAAKPMPALAQARAIDGMPESLSGGRNDAFRPIPEKQTFPKWGYRTEF